MASSWNLRMCGRLSNSYSQHTYLTRYQGMEIFRTRCRYRHRMLSLILIWFWWNLRVPNLRFPRRWSHGKSKRRTKLQVALIFSFIKLRVGLWRHKPSEQTPSVPACKKTQNPEPRGPSTSGGVLFTSGQTMTRSKSKRSQSLSHRFLYFTSLPLSWPSLFSLTCWFLLVVNTLGRVITGLERRLFHFL